MECSLSYLPIRKSITQLELWLITEGWWLIRNSLSHTCVHVLVDHFVVFLIFFHENVSVLFSITAKSTLCDILSIVDKIKNIERLDKGKTGKQLADEFEVGTLTIIFPYCIYNCVLYVEFAYLV